MKISLGIVPLTGKVQYLVDLILEECQEVGVNKPVLLEGVVVELLGKCLSPF
jgi:hypothetical protein